MKVILYGFVILVLACCSTNQISHKRPTVNSKLINQCARTPFLDVKDEESFEEAVERYSDKQRVKDKEKRIELQASLGELYSEIIKAVLSEVDSDLCLHIIGEKPDTLIEQYLTSRNIHIHECGVGKPYMSITNIANLERKTFAVSLRGGCGGNMCSSSWVYEILCDNNTCSRIKEQLCWIE